MIWSGCTIIPKWVSMSTIVYFQSYSPNKHTDMSKTLAAEAKCVWKKGSKGRGSNGGWICRVGHQYGSINAVEHLMHCPKVKTLFHLFLYFRWLKQKKIVNSDIKDFEIWGDLHKQHTVVHNKLPSIQGEHSLVSKIISNIFRNLFEILKLSTFS